MHAVINPNLHDRRVALDALPFDTALFAAIVEDMHRNAGEHTPARAWLDAGGGGQGPAGNAGYASQELLRPWLGFGATRITAQSLFWYLGYLRDIDSLGIVERYFGECDEASTSVPDLLVADLGTMVDLCLMAPFLPERDAPLKIVEVGGGYGRLAEAFLNIYPGQVKYVLVDAVPASLVHAYQYMRSCLPDLRVGMHSLGDPFDLERFDCYIVPTWNAQVLDGQAFDLAINVQSMQEMDQHHVDHYLSWFDRLLADDAGLAYFCNRRDHLFRGQFNYPPHWQCLLKTPTPRAWSRDFPAELFRKGSVCHARENRLRDALYRRELEQRTSVTLAQAKALGYPPY